MANAIVAQMIGQGVVKGGSGLKFRYGDRATRVTLDLSVLPTVDEAITWANELIAKIDTYH